MPRVGTKVSPTPPAPIGEYDHWKRMKVRVTPPNATNKILVDARVYGVLLVYENPTVPGRWEVSCNATSPDVSITWMDRQEDGFKIGDVLQRKETLHVRRLQTPMELKTGFKPWIFSWLATCAAHRRYVDFGQFERGEVAGRV